MLNIQKIMGTTALTLGVLITGARIGMAQSVSPPNFPFQNYHLPTAKRVDDLVSRLTLQEKVAQMMNNAPAIPRLGIASYDWWSEALHGISYSQGTVFPEPIGLASTYDLSLEKQTANAISDEVRAWYNRTGGRGNAERYHGLDVFSPVINLVRDPRWGRGQESYGEDPYLLGQFGAAFIQGMQGNDPKYLKVVATAKHYAVHSGPENDRHGFNATPSLYDLNDTYLPAFEAAVKIGHVQSFMGAFNKLYGIPSNASPLLLQQKLRDEWGFEGYVISDLNAITDIPTVDQYASSMPEAVADAVKAGCDMTFAPEYDALPEAVSAGFITEKQIDVSVKRIFTVRMRLGMFDPPSLVPYFKIPDSVIDSPAHRQIALQGARESIVLLKNQGQLLPLSHSIKSLAVIGPNADNAVTQMGNYAGTTSKTVSVLEGINHHAATSGIKVEYVKAVGINGTLGDTATPIPAESLRSNGKPGLKGEYFRNETLTGPPVATQQDPTVNFVWSMAPPIGVEKEHYSVRWTGSLTAPQDGQYTLAVRGDDGYRLYLAEQKVIDDWSPHGAETNTYTVTLKAGQPVPIRLEYFQATQGAEISLSWRTPSHSPFQDALNAAKRADAVIFVGGISNEMEGEQIPAGGGDRATLDLPAIQEQLLEELATTGKPIVLVMMNGSAMSVNWANDHIPAIVDAWYPGEEGGNAVADVLFGDYNPAGRLPVTFYKSLDQLPDFRDYAMKSRTYRYFEGQPLYPFGYGLSYTKFVYSALSVPKSVSHGQPVTVTATVHNIGSRSGDEVVELYLRPAPGRAEREITPGQPMPRVILAGFQRVPLAAHTNKVVRFTLTPQQLLLVNADGKRILQPGSWQIFVGGSQPDLSGAKPPFGTSLSTLLTVR